MKNPLRSLLTLPLAASALCLMSQSPGKAQTPVKKPAQTPVKKPVQTPAKKPVQTPAKKPAAKGKTEPKPAKKKKEIKTRDADKSDIELPPNATEADIRAIRGAQAMLDAEKRLSQILEKMHVSKKTKFLRFDKIDAWPYEDGFKGMPKDIKTWDGKKVAMAGFMLPIDEVENIKTFYLVKSLWSCCFGIPPDVNGLVKINVKAKKGCAYQYDPILIVGTFRLEKVMDEDYCICIYTMDDATVQVIDLAVDDK